MRTWLASVPRYRVVAGVFFMMYLLLAVSDWGRIAALLLTGIGYPQFPRYAVYFSFFALGFGAIAFTTERRHSVWVLVVIMAVAGYVSAYLHKRDSLSADVIVIAAAIVAYRSKLLNKRPLLVLGLLFGGLLGVRFLTMSGIPQRMWSRLANHVSIAVAIVGFLYWMFEEELVRTGREQAAYRRELDSIVPFAEFGRNATGIVHDFKNDAALFATFASLARQSEGEPLDPENIAQIERASRRLSKRIDMILTVTTAGSRPETNESTFNFREILEASVYVFRANIELRRFLAVDLQGVADDVMIHGSAAHMIAIVENVIRNSCEAVQERQQQLQDVSGWNPRVSMIATGATIVISDNGNGFPYCPEGCRSSNCLYCPGVGMGNTTKENGSGIGLFRVGAAAKRLGVSVVMRSEPGNGVTTTITVPKELVVSPEAKPEASPAE